MTSFIHFSCTSHLLIVLHKDSSWSLWSISLVFILNSGWYCICCTVWGRLLDTRLSSTSVGLYGTIILTCGFFLLGPAPFIPLDVNIYLIVIGTLLFSTGNAANVVATFSGTTQAAISSGASDNIATYGLVGGCWKTCVCMSFFLGFSVGDILLDVFGYEWASMSVITIESVGIVATSLHLYVTRKKLRTGYIQI